MLFGLQQEGPKFILPAVCCLVTSVGVIIMMCPGLYKYQSGFLNGEIGGQ